MTICVDRIIDSEKYVEYEEFQSLGDSSEDDSSSGSEYAPINEKLKIPSVVSQMELSDFVRHLGLPKDGSELLASFRKRKIFWNLKLKFLFAAIKIRNSESIS